MPTLGTEQRPIIVKVKTDETAEKVALICDEHNWQYVAGFDYVEDLTDLKKALLEAMAPSNVYAPCPCGSGKKYKFCCAEKMKSFDVAEYMEEFVPTSSQQSSSLDLLEAGPELYESATSASTAEATASERSKTVKSVHRDPTMEEWQRLYNAAVRFRDIAPWKWMSEDQMFAVANPEDGEVGYCCVMGGGGEFYAIAAYRGIEGLLSYRRMALSGGDDLTTDPDVALGQKALMASFEGSTDVDKRDRSVLKELGLRFRGKHAWPVMRSYEPGYALWYLTDAECRFLTHVLEQACLVVERVRENPQLLSEHEDLMLTREFREDGQDSVWVDAWRPWPNLEDRIHEGPDYTPAPVNEMELKRLVRAGKPSGAWEVDIAYAPFGIGDADRPKYPRMMMCVHGASGMILTAHVADRDHEGSEFVDELVAVMKRLGQYPEAITVKNGQIARLFLPLADGIGADVVEAKRLPGVEHARREMMEVMG